jgi:hypothetical protein
MKKPTVTQIKDSGVLGEYFFSRDAMAYFGQTLATFTTAWFDSEQSVVCLYAPMLDADGVKRGITKRYIKITDDKYNEVVR